MGPIYEAVWPWRLVENPIFWNFAVAYRPQKWIYHKIDSAKLKLSKRRRFWYIYIGVYDHFEILASGVRVLSPPKNQLLYLRSDFDKWGHFGKLRMIRVEWFYRFWIIPYGIAVTAVRSFFLDRKLRENYSIFSGSVFFGWQVSKNSSIRYNRFRCKLINERVRAEKEFRKNPKWPIWTFPIRNLEIFFFPT